MDDDVTPQATETTERPTDDAVIGHVPDADTAAALAADLREAGVGEDQFSHGGDEAFAAWLQNAEADTGIAARLGRWLTSLGQEREELVALGEKVREGKHGVVVVGLEEDAAKDRVVEIMQRHGVSDIHRFGRWETETVLDVPTTES